MKKNYPVLLFIVFLIVGCIHHNQPGQQVDSYNFKKIIRVDINEMTQLDSVPITIRVPNKFETLNIDKVVKEMKYIRLETNKNSIIGRIDKMVFHSNCIFILDRSFSQSIFVFNMEGKHMNTINKKGRGPDEYIGISDFCFNGDTLVVFDGLGAKLLLFNDKGDYLRSNKVGFHFRNIATFSQGDYLIVTRNAQNSFLEEINEYSLLIGIPDSIIKFKGFKNNQFLREFKKTTTNPIVDFQGYKLFSPLLSNYIYQINSDGTYFPKYHLSFVNGLPENYYNLINEEELEKYNYYMGVFQENNSHLFIRFNPPESYYGYVIYNKMNSENICYDAIMSPEGLYLGFSAPKCTYLNYFVGSIEPSDVLRQKDRYLRIHKDSSDITNLINALKENDNPIIIMYLFDEKNS